MSSGPSDQLPLVPDDGSGRRLLILRCSHRKLPLPGLVPAVERYDGPPFRTLRRFRRMHPEALVELWVLSAKHGLFPGDQAIEDYDEQMTIQRAEELQARTLQDFHRLAAQYTSAFIFLSSVYEQALNYDQSNPIDGTHVTVARGPRGTRLAALKNWLYGVDSRAANSHQTVRVTGRTRLNGVTVEASADEILERAAGWLRQGARTAPLRDWYVEVGTSRVGPKWIVSHVFGLPPTAFDASDARRVLYRLGVISKKVSNEPT